MIVIIPCWSGDRANALRVQDLAVRCAAASACRHEVRLIERLDDGRIPALNAEVSAREWPAAPTAVMRTIVAHLPDGAVFLNLEPDAVLTRPTALDELERAFLKIRARWPRSCVMGHWKTPPLTPHAPVEHISGSAVYCITPRFRAAMQRVHPMRPWDLELFFRGYLQPDEGADTQLIRCMWGQDVRHARMIMQRHPKAALIHGDKSGGLLDAIELGTPASAA